MFVLNVQPAYAGSFSVASVQRSPTNASCRNNWSARLTVNPMPTSELSVEDRLDLEAAITGADTRGYRLSFCMAPDLRHPRRRDAGGSVN
jgi:hypothetical protein